MQELISSLFGRYDGKPILVIGGGPSVTDDLPRIACEPACVVSANQHGHYQDRFAVDYMVNVDKIHTVTLRPMRDVLRAFPGKIVNKYSWADIRMGEWSSGYLGNSGTTAIAVAAALGGDPVIVTGVDLWSTGRVYFHAHGPKATRSMRKLTPPRAPARAHQWRGIDRLKQQTAGANVRPVSGALLQWFPQYDPAETLPPREPIRYRRLCSRYGALHIQAVRPFNFDHKDPVARGTVLAVTEAEARHLLQSGVCVRYPLA